MTKLLTYNGRAKRVFEELVPNHGLTLLSRGSPFEPTNRRLYGYLNVDRSNSFIDNNIFSIRNLVLLLGIPLIGGLYFAGNNSLNKAIFKSPVYTSSIQSKGMIRGDLDRVRNYEDMFFGGKYKAPKVHVGGEIEYDNSGKSEASDSSFFGSLFEDVEEQGSKIAGFFSEAGKNVSERIKPVGDSISSFVSKFSFGVTKKETVTTLHVQEKHPLIPEQDKSVSRSITQPSSSEQISQSEETQVPYVISDYIGEEDPNEKYTILGDIAPKENPNEKKYVALGNIAPKKNPNWRVEKEEQKSGERMLTKAYPPKRRPSSTELAKSDVPPRKIGETGGKNVEMPLEEASLQVSQQESVSLQREDTSESQKNNASVQQASAPTDQGSLSINHNGDQDNQRNVQIRRDEITHQDGSPVHTSSLGNNIISNVVKLDNHPDNEGVSLSRVNTDTETDKNNLSNTKGDEAGDAVSVGELKPENSLFKASLDESEVQKNTDLNNDDYLASLLKVNLLKIKHKKYQLKKVVKLKKVPLLYDGEFSSPVPDATNFYVSSGFGDKKGRKKPHNALDFAIRNKEDVYAKFGKNGVPILASKGGTVVEVKIGHNGGYGNYVIIDHGNGYHTLSGHLGNIFVNEGDTVSQGQVMAFMGNTGNVTGHHLHYALIHNGKFINPKVKEDRKFNLFAMKDPWAGKRKKV